MERTSSQNWFCPEWPCSWIRAVQVLPLRSAKAQEFKSRRNDLSFQLAITINQFFSASQTGQKENDLTGVNWAYRGALYIEWNIFFVFAERLIFRDEIFGAFLVTCAEGIPGKSGRSIEASAKAGGKREIKGRTKFMLTFLLSRFMHFFPSWRNRPLGLQDVKPDSQSVNLTWVALVRALRTRGRTQCQL